jgi:hypothetical protein
MLDNCDVIKFAVIKDRISQNDLGIRLFLNVEIVTWFNDPDGNTLPKTQLTIWI